MKWLPNKLRARRELKAKQQRIRKMLGCDRPISSVQIWLVDPEDLARQLSGGNKNQSSQDTALTPEERELRLRKLFGLVPSIDEITKKP